MDAIIADELGRVAAALGAAGIPTTTDLAEVWGLAAGHDTAALIERVEDVDIARLSNPLRFRFVAPVQLVSRGPDIDAQARLLAALPTALRVLQTQAAANPSHVTSSGVVLLSYRIPASRTATEGA